MTPLYACHGIGMHSGFFARQEATLSPRKIVHVNMPGFGGATFSGSYGFPDLARNLGDAIGHEPGNVIGHSMGGMVALELASTRPEKIRSLILCNTTPAFGGKDDTFKKQFVAARLKPLEDGKTMAEMAPASVRLMSAPDTPPRDLDFMADLMAQTPEAAYRAAIECLVTFDRRSALEGLTIPVLLIGGEDDQAAPAKTMRRMAEKIPGAECYILPGGHMTPVEQAEATNHIMLDFLTRVEAP